MLERLADYDEHLMEELLSDVEPPREEVFGDLKREFAECLVVPVLIGSAEGDHGIRRLLKALRHEVPEVAAAAARLGLAANGDTIVQVLKTVYSAHGGKLSPVAGDERLAQGRRGAAHGRRAATRASAASSRWWAPRRPSCRSVKAGDTVALVRLEGIVTGDLLSSGKNAPAQKPGSRCWRRSTGWRSKRADRKDEVKLTAAIAKLIEEDPSLIFEQNAELHEMALAGQGEIHLQGRDRKADEQIRPQAHHAIRPAFPTRRPSANR